MAAEPIPAPFQAEGVLLVRRNWWLLAISASPLLLALAIAAAGNGDGAKVLAVGGLMLVGLVYRRNPRPSFRSVTVLAGRGGVTLVGSGIQRAAISAGLVTPEIAPRVVLRRSLRPSIELQTESRVQAMALLEALGLDAPSAEADFYGHSWITTHWAYALITYATMSAVGYALSRAGVVGKVLSYPLIAFALVVLFWPVRIRVGAEGVKIQWLWVRRYIGYDDIEDVARYEEPTGMGDAEIGLHIQTHTTTLRIQMGVKGGGRYLTSGETEIALAWERMREAASVRRQRLRSTRDDPCKLLQDTARKPGEDK